MLRPCLCLLAFGSACGGGHGAQSDAPSGDGAVLDGPSDAAVDAPVPGVVTVTVYDWSSPSVPAPNEPVAFQNADGSVVAVAMTDPQGMASATMLPGGSVTALRPPNPSSSGDYVYTFVGVKPGDQLQVASPVYVPPPPEFATSFALPYFTGAASYLVTTRCGQGTAAASGTPVAQTYLSCSPVDVYVSARDASSSHLTLAAFYKTGVAVSANATIDLTGETYIATSNVPMTMTNLPTYVDQAYVGLGLFDGKFILDVSSGFPSLDGNGGLSATLHLPPIPGVQLYVSVSAGHRPSGNGPTFLEDVRQLTALTGSYAADASTILIPWVLYGAGVDPIAQQLYWQEDPAGTGVADSVRAEVHVGYIANNMPVNFIREIAGPYTPGHLALPVLPGPLAQYNFTLGRTNGASLFYLLRAPGGWDAVRPTAFTYVPFPNQVGQLSVGSTANGSVRYQP